MNTILITGGAGFVGSHLCKRLWREYPDYKIVVLDALTYAGNLDNIPQECKDDCARFEFWHGDVRNNNLVDMLVAQADVVYHLAASSHVARSIFDNESFFLNDVLGTQSVANAVANHKNVERAIFMSTSEVYGSAIQIPMDEEHPLNPTTPYASAKCGADRLVYSYPQLLSGHSTYLARISTLRKSYRDL
jgi:dTDP-glucose 4,6-dehydratase